MQIEVYRSASYAPELITGKYVRCVGSKRKGYRFRIFETATGTGAYAGKAGCGPTLREYETDGEELPPEIRQEAIKTKNTIKWK